MNMFKKNGGFTLVELIVVIAILAILAGVAVPAYSGYISKAQEANDYTMLDSVKTAAIFAAMEKDEGHDCVITKIVVGNDPANVTVDGTNLSDAAKTVNISSYVASISYKSTGTKGATWVAAASGDLKEGWNLTK